MGSHKCKLMWVLGHSWAEFKNEKANSRDCRHNTKVENGTENFQVAVVRQVLEEKAQGMGIGG